MIMRIYTILFVALFVEATTAFVAPVNIQRNHGVTIHEHGKRQQQLLIRRQPNRHIERFSATSATPTSLGDDGKGVFGGSIFPASIAVGSITAGMGFLYGKALAWSQQLLWKKLPGSSAFTSSPSYIVLMCTLGGLVVGSLSAMFKSEFTVGDFVSAFSSSNKSGIPNSTNHLFPLLLMSLLTSAFGFSLGPEAPMVCAGVLVGNTLARRWNMDPTILSYAGAAGTLTAFMGIPIAGSIFALEMTRSTASMSSSKSLSPSIVASLAALVLLRGVLIPGASVGGHFTYGLVGTLTGRQATGVALLGGILGASIGTVFHKSVGLLKRGIWGTQKVSRRRAILTKVALGLVIGLLSSRFPQTLFWGEGSLQTVIDGQQTAFSATKHGLDVAMTRGALVDPSLPWTAWGAAQVGLAKLTSIALACAGKFPGGIIFPLFFAAAPFAHALAPLVSSSVLPVLVLCTMAATQASATRTPLATSLILTLMASPTTELSIMLPACLLASYGGVYFSQLLSSKSYFQYNK